MKRAAEAIWDNELDRRVAEFDADPDSGAPWKR